MPDFFELRQPDFVKRDLPTFTEKLMLSAEQAAVVERMIEEYLAALQKIAAEHLPKGGDGPMKIDLGQDENGEHTGLMVVGPEDDLGELDEIIEDFGPPDGMPRQLGIGVDMRIGDPAGNEEHDAAVPEPGVFISLDSPDGEEMSPEMREKLEEAAAKIAEKMKKRMEKQIAEGGDPAEVMPFAGPVAIEDLQKRQQEMAAKAEVFRSAKANLRQTFISNVQTTLAAPQMERWPDLDRALRRQKTLPRGRLSGERTDLIRVFASIQPTESERQAVSDELAAYELELDQALQQRNEIVPDSQRKLDEAMQKGDTEKALSILDRATSLRIAVRSVNEKFAEALASKLTDDRAAIFRQAALKASYPSVYRTTHVQRIFDKLKKIEGIDPAVQADLAQLEEAYQIELEGVNTQVRLAVARHEPDQPRRGIEHVHKVVTHQVEPGRLGQNDEQDPIREAFDRRRDLDRRYDKQIKSLLTADQIAQLPKAPSRRRSEPVIIQVPSPPVAQ
jgi:hypothetical protein